MPPEIKGRSGNRRIRHTLVAAVTMISGFNRGLASHRPGAKARPLSIGSIAYGACYAYSPRGTGAVCECSRLLRARLKAGDAAWLARFAARVREQVIERQRFSWFFGRDVVLVPIPGSAPTSEATLWVSAHLVTCLYEMGLAGAAWEGLHRVHAVARSATAPAGERPTVQQHYDSFAVEAATLSGRSAGRAVPDRIVLVDDVITKGRTLLAGAMRLREAFPYAQVRAFALFRTMGLAGHIERLLDPCEGEIRCVREDAWRHP
jgi:hypothetical protein